MLIAHGHRPHRDALTAYRKCLWRGDGHRRGSGQTTGGQILIHSRLSRRRCCIQGGWRRARLLWRRWSRPHIFERAVRSRRPPRSRAAASAVRTRTRRARRRAPIATIAIACSCSSCWPWPFPRFLLQPQRDHRPRQDRQGICESWSSTVLERDLGQRLDAVQPPVRQHHAHVSDCLKEIALGQRDEDG